MGPPTGNTKAATTAAGEPGDKTGRSRLVSNVMFTWAGQMVYFFTGFIMPRMIDHKLGQEVLGVWDFCWSLVAYFQFIDMGITTSVNRYVGRLWGQQDIKGINRVVSSATVALAVTGLLILVSTITVVLALPYLFADRLGGYVGMTQKSVFCLGVMLSFDTVLGAFNGVLTGCHRWELQTIRNVGWYFISVVGMVVALKLGGGLVAMAAITAVCTMMAHVTLVALAYRACPGLKMRWADVHWSTIKELYTYGGKALVPTISEMLLNQTTSLLVIGTLGPGALAVFTRPRALLRQMDTLGRKMSMILVPMASSMQGSGEEKELEGLMVKSVRYSIFLMLPPLIVLGLFGGHVMRLWMGPGYGNWVLPAVLGLGFLGSSVKTPVFSVLSGMNAHGVACLAQLGGSIVSAATIFVALKICHGGLEMAALAVTVPVLLVNLLFLPRLLCGRLGQGLITFYQNVAVPPLLCIVPFSVCLCIGRLLIAKHPIEAAIVCGVGGIALAVSYWKNVVPNRLKSGVLKLREKAIRFLNARLDSVFGKSSGLRKAIARGISLYL